MQGENNTSGIEIPYSADELLDLQNSQKSIFWEEQKKTRAIALFKAAAANVPAYKDFLAKHQIDADQINSWDDFQNVPLTDKKTYLKQYELKDLVWGGTLKNKALNFASTSGSTGAPFYFPRNEDLEWQCSVILESFLKNTSLQTEWPVCVIIAFAMGVWMGGMITFKAFNLINQRGKYPVSILAASTSKPAIFNALKQWSPQFAETILIGYPPFIKDIIDEAPMEGIDLKKLRLRFHFATEGFTEEFREYLTKQAGVQNQYLDTMNIYGSADIGAMGFETPLTILIRKLLPLYPEFAKEIFALKTPTLTQYNPLYLTFEAVQGQVLLTGNNTIPLIRYAIGDNGGVFSFQQMTEILQQYKIDWYAFARLLGIHHYISELPFVYVYERTDLSVSLYGAKIYPDTIKKALQNESLTQWITGKFTMLTAYDEQQNQSLEIHLELKKEKTANQTLME
ncbi:MAG: phenylacetate--CoA ligase family protein, partial [Parcubacteria group bacterium]|nr:phenylacetate--CoA ligase family protein [Parcubacteria group bacterium]